MTETLSKSRLQAEKAFSKVQSQSLARNQMTEELDLIVRAREEKTLRLRNARLAKELSDRQSATAAFILRRDT
jgi:hypothetical protein